MLTNFYGWHATYCSILTNWLLLALAYITVQRTRKTVVGIKIWGKMVVGSVRGVAEGESEGMKRLRAVADGT